MKEKNLKELIQLYIIGELSGDELVRVENTIAEDNEYREEYERMKKLYETFAKNRPDPPADEILHNARTDLMRSIKINAEEETFVVKVLNVLKDILFTNYKVVFSSAATLVVGIFLGYFLFTRGPVDKQIAESGRMVDLDKLNESDLQISNIRLKSPFTEEGQIEFSFDAIKPISYTGNVDDEFTRRLLAQALLTADNPGVRLKTVNTIAVQSQRNFVPDEKVKNALITTLKVDENPGVRREALFVLMKYSLDNDIRDAFLFVLQNDKNSGLRVAA